jgi:hypothetical protein
MARHFQNRPLPDGDTFKVGIFPVEDWSVYSAGGAGAKVYASHNRTLLARDSARIPDGGYVLWFYCENFIERCGVNFTISATY